MDTTQPHDQTKKTNPPNILLITSDQQHYSTLGIHNSKIKTPALDRLAHEGLILNRTYCPNPTCTPTRASLITGMYPSQHGAWSLGTRLFDDVPTIGGYLHNHGYHTALIGKAHFEPLKSTPDYPSKESYPILQDSQFWHSFHGPYYGFDWIELARNHTDEAHVGQHYALWLEESGCKNWRDYFVKPTGKLSYFDHQKMGSVWQIPEKYHYNTWIAERTNVQIEASAKNDKPFFIWASFFDPHAPRILPEPWASMYNPEEMNVPPQNITEHLDNPPYFKLVQVEECPKGLWGHLRKSYILARNSKRLLDYYRDFKVHNVPVVGLHGIHPHFYRQNKLKQEIAAYYGMVSLMDKYIGQILDKLDELNLTENTIVIFTTDHGDYFGQHGLVTKGPFHYEDLIRVPFIVRYPNVIAPNSSSDALQSLVDVCPTICSLIGLPIPISMTGMDQSPVWMARLNHLRQYAICEMHHSPSVVHLKTYITERYKITVHNNAIYGELYDLQNDPGEHQNLWNDSNFADLKLSLLTQFVQAELKKDLITK